MDVIELRRKRIINFVYFAIVLGLSYLFFKYCFWALSPFIFALFIATIVQKPTNLITKKLPIKRGLVSIFFVLFLYVTIGCVVSLVGIKLVDSVKELFSFVSAKITDFPSLVEDVKNWTLSIVPVIPDRFEAAVTENLTEWFDVIREKSAGEVASTIVDSTSGGEGFSFSSFAGPLSGVWKTVKGIPTFFVAVVIAVLSSCFIAADYDWIVNFIKKQVPEKNRHKLSVSKRVVFSSLGKLVRSYALIICITGTEVFIGLNALSLLGIYTGGNILTIAIIIAVFDILPVLGTGTFMIPWAAYSLITGKISLAIGLFIIYAVIYLVRQVIEPKIIGGTVGLPAFLTLMGMYLGSQLFGFIGIFLLPILMIIVKLLNDEGVIHLWAPSDYSKEEPKKPFAFLSKKKKINQ